MISTAGMQAIVDRLRCDRNRNSTKLTYYCIWKKFNQFVIHLDRKPDTWEERLVLFVGFLVDSKRKSSTIKSYISAIRAVLREDGEQLNQNSYLLTSLTKACRYKNDMVRTRLPIRKYLLRLICDSMHKIFLPAQQPYLVTLYQALFMTAYFGMFHVGELTWTESDHMVRAKDVQVGSNKKKLMFVLHTSKTHWHDEKPQIIKISSLDNNQKSSLAEGKVIDSNCPFTCLRKYLRLRKGRKDDNEQFFVFRDRSPVTATNFRQILKKTLQILNLDPAVYNSQGFRDGRSLDLAEMNVSVETLKVLGRWKSNAVFTYLKY